MWNFQGSWLVVSLEIFKGCNIHNFTKLPGVEFSFRNFQRFREKPKQFQGFFSKKIMPLTPLPCLIFSSGTAHSKAIDLNWSYEALAKKEALTISQVRAFASFIIFAFLCVLSLPSLLGRFAHLHWDTSSLGERITQMESKEAPTFPIYIYLL